ncbi:hypothetical protein M3Y95_00483900 [Aphelenchoides besseyi]|nr:hypothetical protein M3Y95_00483900 [Aphelenchoides besseyi]
MPLFGESSSAYDEAVEKVTAETLTTENWALMIDISDRVSREGAKGAKQCLLAIKKRLNHRDPHVVLFALSLLDCLWNNSTVQFRREVSSNEFTPELTYRATGSNRVVAEKTRELIKKWSENECKKDPSLSLIDSLYHELLDDGYEFDTFKKPKKEMAFSNDPNVVHTEEEEADIAKAIALSLSDQNTNKSSQPTTRVKQETRESNTVIRQVRALYDFEAVEDNEITFSAGDIINVFDCSDQNWWRGQHTRGGNSGLFPASFVSSDLTAPEEIARPNAPVQNQHVAPPQPQIDEAILNKCFELLDRCDPTGVVPDDPALPYFEQMSLTQAPLIDHKLAQIDKQHNLLANMDLAIREVLARYDQAMQQGLQQGNQTPQMPQHYQPPQQFHPQTSSMSQQYGQQQMPPPQSQYVQYQQFQQPPQQTKSDYQVNQPGAYVPSSQPSAPGAYGQTSGF